MKTVITLFSILLILFIIYLGFHHMNIHMNIHGKPHNTCNCDKIKVYIAESKYGGRGVFANQCFRKNEVVEIAPYIETPGETVDGTFLDYVFEKDENTDMLCLGNVSMINHCDDFNVELMMDGNNVVVIATKDIEKDGELLISYGDAYWNERTIEKIV